MRSALSIGQLLGSKHPLPLIILRVDPILTPTFRLDHTSLISVLYAQQGSLNNHLGYSRVNLALGG